MVVVIKEDEITVDSLLAALEKFGKIGKIGKTKSAGDKTLAKHYGKLKWGIDGLEYQKTVRSEWD